MKVSHFKVAAAIIVFAALVLDTDTAKEGVHSGMQVCMQSAVPSLLPFLIISKYLSGSLYGMHNPLLAGIGALCGIPKGLESILGVSLIGGYPVGAQIIADAWEKHYIDRKTAQRMLGFCNNAGPAFIFGVCAVLFSAPGIGWLIFMIQLLSAILCGIIIPGKKAAVSKIVQEGSTSFVSNLNSAIRSMAGICGWIICFRVVLSYIERYFPMENETSTAILYGVFELVNGTMAIRMIPSEAARFIVLNGMLSFGGLCVWMQTAAASKGLSLKSFCFSKIFQSLISVVLAVIIWSVLFL